MTRLSRVLMVAAAMLLGAMYVLPLWRITLIAPQYPEGLGMVIRIDTLTGAKPADLDNINGLNHYIGMRAITPGSIPELRIMPWIVGALIAFGLVAAALGRRRIILAWLVAVVAFGIGGVADFWRWSYDYGHNLDTEHAIIKVPGMTYQPPLIGSKQLLNFRATSWPAPGVWAAGVAALFGLAAFLTACAPSKKPQAINFGADVCDYCRMVISDPRFAAQALSPKGKVHRFDSAECLAGYVRSAGGRVDGQAWVTDFRSPGSWVPAEKARYIRVTKREALSSPMGLGLFALPDTADAAAEAQRLGGEVLGWSDVLALMDSTPRAPAHAP